jgi:hypothetical protein
MVDGIRNFPKENPGECIGTCYRLTRELLEISGLKRERNMELFNYGVSLKNIDYNLSKDVLAVFFIYSKTSYSSTGPAREDAEVTSERIMRIRNNLVDNLKFL